VSHEARPKASDPFGLTGQAQILTREPSSDDIDIRESFKLDYVSPLLHAFKATLEDSPRGGIELAQEARLVPHLVEPNFNAPDAGKQARNAHG
jgi:hypothetical protein